VYGNYLLNLQGSSYLSLSTVVHSVIWAWHVHPPHILPWRTSLIPCSKMSFMPALPLRCIAPCVTLMGMQMMIAIYSLTIAALSLLGPNSKVLTRIEHLFARTVTISAWFSTACTPFSLQMSIWSWHVHQKSLKSTNCKKLHLQPLSFALWISLTPLLPAPLTISPSCTIVAIPFGIMIMLTSP